MKQKPRALLLAGIRAYAHLHEDKPGDGRSSEMAVEHARSAATDQRHSTRIPVTAGNDDASLDSFVASFIAEVEDSPGTFGNLRY